MRDYVVYLCANKHIRFADTDLKPGEMTCQRIIAKTGKPCGARLRKVADSRCPTDKSKPVYIEDGIAYFRGMCPICRNIVSMPYVGGVIEHLAHDCDQMSDPEWERIREREELDTLCRHEQKRREEEIKYGRF